MERLGGSAETPVAVEPVQAVSEPPPVAVQSPLDPSRAIVPRSDPRRFGRPRGVGSRDGRARRRSRTGPRRRPPFRRGPIRAGQPARGADRQSGPGRCSGGATVGCSTGWIRRPMSPACCWRGRRARSRWRHDSYTITPAPVPSSPRAHRSGGRRGERQGLHDGRPADASRRLIEPRTLVERLAAGEPASSLDFIAAVLRLAPEGRHEALTDAARPPARGRGRPVCARGQGVDRLDGRRGGGAARVRSPGADDSAVDRRHSRLGPRAASAATLALQIVQRERQVRGARPDVQPPPTDRVGIDVPTALMLDATTTYSWLGRPTRRCSGGSPPSSRATANLAALGSLVIGRNVDWWSGGVGEPRVPRAVPRAPAGAGPARAGAARLSRWARRMPANAAWRRTLRASRSPTVDLMQLGLAQGFAAAAAVQLDRPQRWALSLADVAAESVSHARVVANGDQPRPAVSRRPARRFAGPAPPAVGRAAGRIARRRVRRWARGSPELVGVRRPPGASPVDPR